MTTKAFRRVGHLSRCLSTAVSNTHLIWPEFLSTPRAGGNFTLTHTKTSSSYSTMEVDITPDKSKFTVKLPGWSSDDMNGLLSDLKTPWYLRVWRILTTIDYVRESAKRGGYLEMSGYEETHFTYFKCVSLKKLVPLSSLRQLASPSHLPYGYPVTVTSELGRIGKTSFQLDHVVKATDTQLPLFSSSIVHVAVDNITRKVAPNPIWWSEKYNTCVSGGTTALRVDLPRLTSGDKVARSSVTVHSTDLDYYGHATNTAYFHFAAGALLAARYSDDLDPAFTLRRLEESISYTELDFVSDSALGDVLETRVFADDDDPNTLYCQIYRGDNLVYVQKFVYEALDNAKL